MLEKCWKAIFLCYWGARYYTQYLWIFSFSKMIHGNSCVWVLESFLSSFRWYFSCPQRVSSHSSANHYYAEYLRGTSVNLWYSFLVQYSHINTHKNFSCFVSLDFQFCLLNSGNAMHSAWDFSSYLLLETLLSSKLGKTQTSAHWFPLSQEAVLYYAISSIFQSVLFFNFHIFFFWFMVVPGRRVNLILDSSSCLEAEKPPNVNSEFSLVFLL